MATAPGPDPVVDLAVGDEVELEIGNVAHGGVCVARAGGPGGRVVFVRYALPGERALVRITDQRNLATRSNELFDDSLMQRADVLRFVDQVLELPLDEFTRA